MYYFFRAGKPNVFSNRPLWQATTEPLFVTRPRPSSSFRPKPTKKPVTITSLSTLASTVAASPSSTPSSTSSSTSTTTVSVTQQEQNHSSTSNSVFPTTTALPGFSNYQYSGRKYSRSSEPFGWCLQK